MKTLQFFNIFTSWASLAASRTLQELIGSPREPPGAQSELIFILWESPGAHFRWIRGPKTTEKPYNVYAAYKFYESGEKVGYTWHTWYHVYHVVCYVYCVYHVYRVCHIYRVYAMYTT